MTRPEPDSGVAHLRVPPHSLEAEQSVLGALLLSNEAWDHVGDLLTDADFYRFEHRLIYGAIGALVMATKPADTITVFEHLQAQGKEHEVGGLAYLNNLSASVPNAANVRRYAEVVRERAVLRKLIAACDEVATRAFNTGGQTAAQILGQAQEKLFALGDAGAGQAEPQLLSDLVPQALREVEEKADAGGVEITGIATGFDAVDEMLCGLQRGDLVILAARPSMGKALSTDAMLLTPGGWVRMGDISVGDAVIGRNGKPCTVTGVYPQGDKQLYRVVFDDGAVVECCDEHLWFTSSRADRKAGKPGQVRTLAEIRATLRGSDGRLSHQVPWVQPMDLQHAGSTPLDPYLLGLWLGDGSISRTRIMFHNPELDLVARFRGLLPAGDELCGDGKDWRVRRLVRNNSTTSICNALTALGLRGVRSETKFVPPQYLWANAAGRLALLRGLLDTDGYTYGAGVEYTTASPDLASAVRFLVRSLGGRVTTTVRTPTFMYLGEKRRGLPSHRMVIAFDSDIVPVSSAKHLAVWRGVTRRTGRYVRSVEPTSVKPAQCISVAADDGLFVTDDFVVTHNTAFALNIAEHVAIVLGLPVAVFSMEMGGSQLALRSLASVGKINGHALRKGRLGQSDWSNMTAAAHRIAATKVLIDESPALSHMDICTRSRRAARRLGKLGLIVIDYLQLMRMSSGDENRATAIGDITRALKGLAKELQCPVIALSQLNRSVETRPDKRPIMSDIRESGSVEQDADVIKFIYRADYYDENCPEPGVAEIIIGKNRCGPTGTAKLAFLKPMTKFENLDPNYTPPPRESQGAGRKKL